MKRNHLLTGLLMFLLFSCEEEEFISQRDYPFIESIGVTKVDEKGATVEFEVLKNGRAPIDEYGLRFIESDKARYKHSDSEFYWLTKSGNPSAGPLVLRIDYDLVKDVNYLVKPYVKVGSTYIFGETLNFLSEGVNPPIIEEVSTDKIYFSALIRIKGDFFNSRLENNVLEIPGIEANFYITKVSASNQELVFKVTKNSNNLTPTNKKFDLVLKSGGKVLILPAYFSLDFPSIKSVTPMELFVGEFLQIGVNAEYPANEFSIKLSGSSASQILKLNSTSGTSYSAILGNLPSGPYNVILGGSGFQDTYSESIQVKKSWTTYSDFLSSPNLEYSNRVIMGDRMLLLSNGGINSLKSFTIDSRAWIDLSDLPNVGVSRQSPLATGYDDRYFYFGLGFNFKTGNEQNFKDFHRFDFQNNTWERLADFPFELSHVSKSFAYQGKIYVIMNNYLNFRVYDPASNSWELSPIQVPNEMRNRSFVIKGNTIYSMASEAPLKIITFQIGGPTTVFFESQSFFSNSVSLFSYKNQLLILGRNYEWFRLDMMQKKLYPFQLIEDSRFSNVIPWSTSRGLMMAFPLHRINYSQENKIYQLIQPLD